MFGLTGGLIPCPASITVLLLCLQLKKFALGAALVLSFSVGLAITMVSVGAAAALSVQHASNRWSGFDFFAGLPAAGVTRVRGSAVFLTRVKTGTRGHRLVRRYTHALQEPVVTITIEPEARPRVDDENRATLNLEAPNFWRVSARYGFLERPDVVHVLESLAKRGFDIELDDATYYVGLERSCRETMASDCRVRWSRSTPGPPQCRGSSDAFNFPRDRLIEIGGRVAIAAPDLLEHAAKPALPRAGRITARDEHPHGRNPHDRRRDPAEDDERPARRVGAHHRFLRSQQDDDDQEGHGDDPVDDRAPEQSLHRTDRRILDDESGEHADRR